MSAEQVWPPRFPAPFAAGTSFVLGRDRAAGERGAAVDRWYKSGMAGDEYRALVLKVEDFTSAVTARRASDLTCKRGCDGCCHTWLTVSAIEAEQVQSALAGLSPEQRERVRARGQRELARAERAASETRGNSAQPRCAMLEDDGACAIYAARPLVCRTQGHALRYPADFVPEAAVRLRTKAGVVTWCPLNYTGAPPSAEDVLDAERVDQILALVGHRHAGSAEAAQARTGLSELAAHA